VSPRLGHAQLRSLSLLGHNLPLDPAMASYGDLVARLAAHAARLESGELDGEANKRARKRVQAKIGACKKELAALGGGPVATGGGVGAAGSGGGRGNIGGSSVAHASSGQVSGHSSSSGGGVGADGGAVVSSPKAHVNAGGAAELSSRKAKSHPAPDDGGGGANPSPQDGNSGKRRRVEPTADGGARSSSSVAIDGARGADTKGNSEQAGRAHAVTAAFALAAPTGKLARKKKLKQLNSQLSQVRPLDLFPCQGVLVG
jgi:hypothetical protein